MCVFFEWKRSNVKERQKVSETARYSGRERELFTFVKCFDGRCKRCSKLHSEFQAWKLNQINWKPTWNRNHWKTNTHTSNRMMMNVSTEHSDPIKLYPFSAFLRRQNNLELHQYMWVCLNDVEVSIYFINNPPSHYQHYYLLLLLIFDIVFWLVSFCKALASVF